MSGNLKSMKKCSMCKQEKSEDLFARKRGGLQAHCKDCQKIKIREWYKQNRQYQINKTREDRQKIRQRLRELKEGPCTDCKKTYPYYVMDWDHVRGQKVGNMGQLSNSGGLQKALEELKKCELVCANCHRERTHQRENRVDT